MDREKLRVYILNFYARTLINLSGVLENPHGKCPGTLTKKQCTAKSPIAKKT